MSGAAIRRRHWLAAALAGSAAGRAVGQTPEWSLQAQLRLWGGPSAKLSQALAERRRLAETGEARLAAGDADGAQQAFDAAAGMVHSADVEIGLVRSYMQAGEYRRALAFGAHAAGAHRDVSAGTALYAWLLHVGGQGRVARHLLDEALALRPEDPDLRAARDALAQDWPLARGRLLDPPLRAAPYSSTPGGATAADRPQPGARVAGTATLVDQGRRALVPAAGLPAGGRVWLRNGLGQAVAASLEDDARLPGVRVLRAGSALPWPGTLAAAGRDPFAGSPGCLLEYSTADDGDAAWPLLHQGFFGRPTAAAAPWRELGLRTPAGPRGGPVFDQVGRWAGIALPGDGGPDRLLPVSAWPAAWRPAASVDAAPAAPIDQVYESALRVALQLIVAA